MPGRRTTELRYRVAELRENVDRIRAELVVAERERKEWAIARSWVDEVPAPRDEDQQAQAGLTATVAEEQTGKTSQVRKTGRRKRRCRWGARDWPGQCCRCTTSASGGY